VSPGEIWQGHQKDHPWKVEIKKVTARFVELAVLGRGANLYL
jgi:hypothetical protein